MGTVAMQGPDLGGLGVLNALENIVPVYVIGYEQGILFVNLEVFPAGCEDALYACGPEIAIEGEWWYDVDKLVLNLHQFTAIHLVFA